MVHTGTSVDAKGHLHFGGADTVELAKTFGTPAYILDENIIRSRCRIYSEAMEKHFGAGSRPLYASKALSFKEIYRIAKSESMAVDAVSPGEIYTALSAGFPASDIFFHGNNKTDDDIRYALNNRVGTFVVDNLEELDSLDAEAGKLGIKQRILLRITPGIDPHTHRAVITGNIDSKFGSAIATGQAEAIVKAALGKKNLTLMGFHCHIGSQIFDSTPFVDASRIMAKFIADIKKKTGYEAAELNLGGGFGVPYVEGHPQIDYDERIGEVAEALKSVCDDNNIKQPVIFMEPGRSIVADAGITLYTVGSYKSIPGFKDYVSIDGGMPDNPRYALYQSPYEISSCNHADLPKTLRCTLAGRCCESGDLIGENMEVQPVKRGDIIAVFVTGAYNYSMASNYNRIPRPPVIIVKDGVPRIAVKRETFEQLTENDM